MHQTQGFKPAILKKLRKARRLSQEETAGVIGVTRSTYGKKERGELPINIGELKSLADFYGMDIRDFFPGKSPEPPEQSPPPQTTERVVRLQTVNSNPADLYLQDSPDSSELSRLIIQLNMDVQRLRLKLKCRDQEIEHLKNQLKSCSCTPPHASIEARVG